MKNFYKKIRRGHAECRRALPGRSSIAWVCFVLFGKGSCHPATQCLFRLKPEISPMPGQAGRVRLRSLRRTGCPALFAQRSGCFHGLLWAAFSANSKAWFAARKSGSSGPEPSNKKVMGKIIIGLIMVVGGLSGKLVLIGTNSGAALAVLGGVLIVWGMMKMNNSQGSS
jgi:hypothetical protein